MIGASLAIGAAGIGGYIWISNLARSGTDLDLTYRVYHEGWLGAVRFDGCDLYVGEPWFPKLDDYHSLLVTDSEVVFIDVKSPLREDGKAVAINFIRGAPATKMELLGPLETLGSTKVRGFPESVSSQSGLSSMWLPDTSWYAVSKSRDALINGLKATTINCVHGEKKVER